MIYTLILAALSMEIIGSYISIVGLSSVFAKDPIILAMVVSLDVAKIVTVSFVYRNWRDLNIAMRSYMAAAVVVLMMLTSTGLFGYLSSAFMGTITPVVAQQEKTDRLENKLSFVRAERERLLDRQKQIELQIANLPTESIKGRTKLLAAFKEDRDSITAKLTQLDTSNEAIERQLDSVKNVDSSVKTHVGPILYISKITGLPLEHTVTWLIVVIIAVFEPLAVLMVIAANYLIAKRENDAAHPVVPTMEVNVAGDLNIDDAVTCAPAPTEVAAAPNGDVRDVRDDIESTIVSTKVDAASIEPVTSISPIAEDVLPKKRQRRPRKKKEPSSPPPSIENVKTIDSPVSIVDTIIVSTPDEIETIIQAPNPTVVSPVELPHDENSIADEQSVEHVIDYQASLLDDIKSHEIKRLYPKRHQHTMVPTHTVTDVYTADNIPQS